MRCTVVDFLELPTTHRVEDGDTGFLHVPGRFARAGVQAYRAREIDGLKGYPADAVIRLYRAPDELRKPACLASFENKPITDGHPNPAQYPYGVTKDNWSTLAKGHANLLTADVAGNVDGMLHLTDAAGIDSLKSGRRQISLGYGFNLDMSAGRTPDGQVYEGAMTDIVGNHIAIVDRARGGDGCRAADSKTGDKAMRKIIVDSIPFDMDDTLAGLVEGLLRARDSALADLATATTTHKKALDALGAAKDTEIRKLRDQIISPEVVVGMANDRATVLSLCASRCPTVKVDDKMSTAVVRAEMFKAITADNAAAKKIGEAVLPGGLTDKTPDGAVKVALDAIFAAGDIHAHDGEVQRTAVAQRLTGTTPVGEKDPAKVRTGDTAPKLSGRAAYMQNMTQGQQTK